MTRLYCGLFIAVLLGGYAQWSVGAAAAAAPARVVDIQREERPSTEATGASRGTFPPPVRRETSTAPRAGDSSEPPAANRPVGEQRTTDREIPITEERINTPDSPEESSPASDQTAPPQDPPPQQDYHRGAVPALGTLPEMPQQRIADQSHDSDWIYSELLVSSRTMQDAERHRRVLQGFGLRIKQRKLLKGLDWILSIYRVPPQDDPMSFLASLTEQLPDVTLEYNRNFAMLGAGGKSAKQYARHLIGLSDTESRGERLSIAMLDSAINLEHPALRRAAIRTVDVTGGDGKATQHGTAVASLLVGRDSVEGLLPEANLLAVTIFAEDNHGEQRTRSDWWLYGLNELAQARPTPAVVNMSFGGGHSVLLAGALDYLIDAKGMILVAAAGNGGPRSELAFPASLEKVIAVTAVDSRKRLYMKAPQRLTGPALAAPGVDIWAADADVGGFYASGSSFASPWVTAVMALAKQSGQEPEAVLRRAQDLGEPGYDPAFGAGLLYWR